VSPALALLASLRPRQWVKNLFVFAGVIFSQQMLTPHVWTAVAAFAIFCALSGAMYLFNDVADADRDRLHPSKRLRPIASGQVSRPAAVLGVPFSSEAASPPPSASARPSVSWPWATAPCSRRIPSGSSTS